LLGENYGIYSFISRESFHAATISKINIAVSAIKVYIKAIVFYSFIVIVQIEQQFISKSYLLDLYYYYYYY